uniref:Uncharacterized protein n=1 Tax=Anopheles atroparvus TaxID=41427 RepID=A0A182ISX9_ANOAO
MCMITDGGPPFLLICTSPFTVTLKHSSSPRTSVEATSLLTTQYSGRSSSMSESSGRSFSCRLAGSQDVKPSASEPTKIESVFRIWMISRSPILMGRGENTYPWQNSVSARVATYRSAENLMLRPRTGWKGRGSRPEAGLLYRTEVVGLSAPQSGQAYLGRLPRSDAGSLQVNPNRITPLQLLEMSRNFTQTRSLTRTGRALKVMPLQNDSYRLATVPSREIRMLSPCTLWNWSGGRLFGPGQDDALLVAVEVNPNRITPLQLLEMSRNFTQTRSLTRTGRALKVMPLQNDSYRLATVPSREIRMERRHLDDHHIAVPLAFGFLFE